jgi:hypothetical protein
MNQQQWRAYRWFIAIFVGLPVTLLGAFYLIGGGLMAGVVLSTEPFSPWASFVAILWFAAGLAGLIGFWMWVLQPPAPLRARRLLTASLLTAGIIAMAPFVVWESMLIAWAAIGTAIFAIASLLINYPLEPTGEQHG